MPTSHQTEQEQKSASNTPISACCSPKEQETCCEPSAKSACCGTPSTNAEGKPSCGCR